MRDFDPWAEDPNEPGRYANPYTAPSTGQPWTDPDTAAPEWLTDPNHDMSANNPGVGNRWAFVNGQWTIVPMPRGTQAGPEQTRYDEPYPNPYPEIGGGGGGYQPAPRHSLSSLNYPQFNGPQFQTPKPFEYENFTLPTMKEAENEPGFDYALKQGIKAYENSKAYLGTYRSGGTIKGLNDYARNMATQNYDKVFERKAQTYDRNRNNAADAYATNYGISRDVFDRNYTSAKDQYAPKARESELNFARDWDVYAYEGDDDYRRWKAMIDANTP